MGNRLGRCSIGEEAVVRGEALRGMIAENKELRVMGRQRYRIGGTWSNTVKENRSRTLS